MAEAKRWVRPAISVVLIGATILGAVNVFGDVSEVKALAEREACGKPGCAVTMTRMARNPIEQSFTFQVDLKTQRTVDVDCHRAYYLLGSYSCRAEGPPAASR